MLTIDSKDEEIMRAVGRVMHRPELMGASNLYGDGKNLKFRGTAFPQALREKRAQLVQFLNESLNPKKPLP